MAECHLTFIVPGSIDTRTGGYEYDRRMIDGLRVLGWTVAIRELGAGFPNPTRSELDAADSTLAERPDGSLVLIDGLAFGAMSEQARRHASRLRLVPIVHALLADEVGIDAETVAARRRSEAGALSVVDRLIAVGDSLIPRLAALGVDRGRVVVAKPGTDRAPLARGSGDGPLHFVTVATLNPGKGHAVLMEALANLGDRRWRLTCAGSMTRHPATAARVRSMVRDFHLEDRVALAGEQRSDAIAALYDRADLFVLPTLAETHPLSVLEALARGLPIVSTTVGAIPDLVCAADSPAGLLVPPADPAALAGALARVLDDGRLRSRLAEGARQVREALPTWHDASRQLSAALT